MPRTRSSTSGLNPVQIDEALDAMGAEELRELVRDLVPYLDEKTHARLVNALIDRAARGESGWTPTTPSDETLREITAFAQAARRIGYADPADVDHYLRQASNAFLGKDYKAAFAIYRALLVPLGEAEIDIGQHEEADEVLGVDISACTAQYVVSSYMIAAPANRAEAVRSAIDKVGMLRVFSEPLRQMERVAVEPMPNLEDFLPRWRSLIATGAGEHRSNEWDTEEDHWLREVVFRLEGIDGLATIARSTQRALDFRAWCNALVEARDWAAALSAFEEAASTVSEESFWRGDFFDGAALAAQELKRSDLPVRLERAWREAPGFLRLCRWLGSSDSRTTLRGRVSKAMDACPQDDARQRALLHMLLEESEPAAKLLASAPGLGWSQREHPGHLLFPFFCDLLGAATPDLDRARGLERGGSMEIDELEEYTAACAKPRLSNPSIDELIEIAGIRSVAGDEERAAILAAMRTAAEKRLAGVTTNKRRRYYWHAALLAAACVEADPTPATTAWMTEIRAQYRRFSALQSEFTRYTGQRRA